MIDNGTLNDTLKSGKKTLSSTLLMRKRFQDYCYLCMKAHLKLLI